MRNTLCFGLKTAALSNEHQQTIPNGSSFSTVSTRNTFLPPAIGILKLHSIFYLAQAFLSASKPSGFAETLSFLLKVLSFFSKFWVLRNFQSEFCFQVCLSPTVHIHNHVFAISVKIATHFGVICLVFCIDFYQICRNLEFCGWVLSFFLVFSARSKKKPGLKLPGTKLYISWRNISCPWT